MPVKHWGQWIWERAETRGYHSQRALADRVNVTPAIMSGWINSEHVPRLRDTSIESLCSALNLHRDLLLADYVFYDPDDAPDIAEYELKKSKPLTNTSEMLNAIKRIRENRNSVIDEEYYVEEVFRIRAIGMLKQLDGGYIKSAYDQCKDLYEQWLKEGEAFIDERYPEGSDDPLDDK